MNISGLQFEGEWLRLGLESKKLDEELSLKVKPLSSDDQLAFAEAGSKDIRDFFSMVQDLVIDWDLEKDGAKLPCNEENKKQYLPYLIPLKVKPWESESI